MSQFDNYEQFCQAFISKDEEQKKNAKLVLFIQNWIIRIIDYVEEDTLDYSLKKMVDQKAERMPGEQLKDALSSIVDDSALAFRHLSENMKEKIIRENVQMPVYKVKEINSYGLNWLSRQSGRTIRQKISSAGNSIMAVQRRMSFDTAENRLFIAFAKEIYEQLNTKLESFEEIDRRRIEKEENMRDELAVFLRRDDISEVRRWENLPPNNTLLSDQNYKKIWHAWNQMKKLDERVKNDSNYIEKRLTTIFFIELLVYFRELLQVPQMPVEIDYDSYDIYLCEEQLFCLDGDGNTIKINKKDNCIYLNSPKKNICVEFRKNIAIIIVNGEEKKRYEVTHDKIYTYIRFIASKLGVGGSKKKIMEQKSEIQKFSDITVDLFSLHPEYIGDNMIYGKLTERILQQKYSREDIDGDLKDYYIPCDNSSAITMISGVTNTYTIPFAVDNGSMEQMKRLVHMMENYIVTDSFTYVFPDAYNELQLSMVHKAAKMVYGNVRNVPLSIGAAFKYQTTENFKSRFEIGDFLLVVNLIDDEVTFTLVAGEHDEKIGSEVSDYNGLVWERHPTTAIAFKEEIYSNVVDLLTKAGCAESEKVYKLLGLDGLCDEAGNLSILFGNDEWFRIIPEIKQRVKQFKMNITGAVTEFLRKNKSVIQGKKVHIISLIDNFLYKGNESFCNMTKQEILEGCKELERLEKLTDRPLWHDHLPALAIKLLYGKFDLIKNVRVIPQFNGKQEIPISGIFTLPRNCQEYHFDLVQDENARKMQYEAVIKNPAFPLSRDVECELKMTYEYGAEDPYELYFVPIKKDKAEFVEAKVIWKKVDIYEYKNMGYPEFPLPCSWEELQHYKSNRGISNLLNYMIKGFEQIAKGYEYFDFSKMNEKYSGNRGKIEVDIDGIYSVISWNQSSWENESNIPEVLTTVSFLLEEDKREPVERYRISNLHTCCIGNNVWHMNKYNCYQCLLKMNYRGKTETIALYETDFLADSPFSIYINDVSFGIVQMKNGRFKAIEIHNEEEGPYIEPNRYFAKGMRAGNVPPMAFAGSQFYFSLYKTFSFANNRSLSERECPIELQQAFSKALNSWVDLYDVSQDKILSRRILLGMSLMARDVGKVYFKLANEAIDMYVDNKVKLADEIGCGLGDLSNKEERDLLTHMLDVLPSDKMVYILSKAVWHNKDFIKNIDTEILLKYFEIAIKQIYQLLKEYKFHTTHQNKTWKTASDMSRCMEYILAVFRLRELKEDVIDKNYLSLNSKPVRNLYRYLEEAIDLNIRLQSFLKFEVTNKGVYQNIPDLIYILLVYITGKSAEGEIHISGLDMDEEE